MLPHAETLVIAHGALALTLVGGDETADVHDGVVVRVAR